MNRNLLKTYAPQARRVFIQAVIDRAAKVGLTAKGADPVSIKGGVAIINGHPYPQNVAEQRDLLEQRVARQGFDQVMEAIAYTWFNRFVAIRFMELHGYLEHGYRVLSHPNAEEAKGLPEIVQHAENVNLPGLDQALVVDLKLGNKDEPLYRMLLIAQCNALHATMPFLFERVNDETDLLLPENLLHTDSIVRKLVNAIPEEDWKEVEIIGWLYQFYISERKDEVIGKVVASEDIPAATQLFTPNWIVKYLLQNTLGRQWMATYPDSPLKSKMKYYIEPAEQAPEVKAQLKAITPESLDPEVLTLLDPACGSGHILVEAYELLKEIYLERGYRLRDIPMLILSKNLFGLEIDDRAAQLAAYALMMKARADDHSIFESRVQPNILAIKGSKGMIAADITLALNAKILSCGESTVSQGNIAILLDLFENGDTFGSLIQIPSNLAATMPKIEQRLKDVLKHGDLTHAPAHVIKSLLKQAQLLAGQYDVVIANPPYMGGKFYNSILKAFINKEYKNAKADLCTAFIERGLAFTNKKGLMGQITMHSWMFLSSFETFRAKLMQDRTMRCMAHLGPNAFPQIGGQVVQVTAFVVNPMPMLEYRGSYKRLIDGQSQEKEEQFHIAKTYTTNNEDFAMIPGSPVAYWTSERMRRCYSGKVLLSEIAEPRQGMATSDNNRFLRRWAEVSWDSVNLGSRSCEDANASAKKWFPYNKGGEYRRWYGNNEYLINWKHNGDEVIAYAAELYGSPTRTIKNIPFYFRPCATWSFVSSNFFGVRYSDPGFIFDVGGSCAFCNDETVLPIVTSYLCSSVAFALMQILNPTVNFQSGNVASLPWPKEMFSLANEMRSGGNECISIARSDWDSFETSWNFLALHVIQHKMATLLESQESADAEYLGRFTRMKELEEENNRLFIQAYGLQDELSPVVPDDQITLYSPNREEDIKRLISYAIGCMQGRYSLDKPGLIYAHSGNEGFDPSQYTTFSADADGILPITDYPWFPDDVGTRVVEFISVAWPKEHLEVNLTFVAESLGANKGEESRDTIRRYLAQSFFKDHLRTYKKRPIYWLFSSGKQRAFQCLVYLHRYNEGTLARMRTEYVIPLQGKIAARIDYLEGDIGKATSGAHRKKLEKERETLRKQQTELLSFDEKLRHFADKRIKLDLDDGVKVNYGKFGDLLADVNTVTGGGEEE